MSRAQEITQLRENVSRLVGAIQAERDSYLILKERLAELELGEKELAATAVEHIPDAARVASVAKVESDIKAWRSKEVNHL